MIVPSQGSEDAPHSKRISRISSWVLHTGDLDTCLAQTVSILVFKLHLWQTTENHFEFLVVLKATQGIEQLMTKKTMMRYLGIFKFFFWWPYPLKPSASYNSWHNQIKFLYMGIFGIADLCFGGRCLTNEF